MRILIYTTYRTGSTSLANFLIHDLGYNYQRYSYFKSNINSLPSDIVIKLTPNEIDYSKIKSLFDKRIILIREDSISQSESRVYSEHFGKKFSAYKIPQSFLEEHEIEILHMRCKIEAENNMLQNLDDALILTYEELYQSDIGLIKLEKYLDIKFKFTIEYKRYRNMKQNLV
jgi:hypothetical protein